MNISVIIPVLNEAAGLPGAIASARSPSTTEIIVVDGGSTDGSVRVARSQGAKALTSEAGRGRQMNAGALAASGDALVFLHADTLLPAGFDLHIQSLLGSVEVAAGAFLLAIDGSRPGYRLIEYFANLRSRKLQTPYGDQALFLRTADFLALGGFREIPIMEDFEFIRRARRLGRICIAPASVSTSSRRWETLGILRTTLINQLVVIAYHLGMSPDRIRRLYHGTRQPD